MTDAIETGAERPKTPIWFWIVAVLALIWNGFGAMDYTLTQMGNEAYLAAFTEEQLAFYLGFPLWYEAVWAIAVWSAVLGSVVYDELLHPPSIEAPEAASTPSAGTACW